MDNATPFDLAAVLADAQRKEALTDWGPGEFEYPLDVLLANYASADLNAVGVHILRSGIVHSLRMRLRAQEWIRRNPAILDERVAAPVVVVGMMRSGTTLLQRLLAADPRFHCAYGWEVVEVAPKLDQPFTGVDPRIAVSEAREAKSRELAPDLFAIHPMYAREAEEEIVFLADAFLSHVPESGAHLPNYRSWLDAQDFTPAYTYLHRMLQFLQWQKRQQIRGGHAAQRWVLKSPAHLGYLARCGPSSPTCTSCTCTVTLAPRSPRGPASTRPCTRCMPIPSTCIGWARSGCSGWAGPTTAQWRSATPGPTGAERVTDIGFDDAVADPIGQVARVYDDIGLPLTVEAENAMRRWRNDRPREATRPPYGLEGYGLRPEQVDERFALYNKRFEQYVGK